MSVVYATGLISGNTYYVQVGTYGSSTTTGTFCMTVDEMNSLMLALTATCASTPQSIFGTNPTYTGWVPILDASSKLIALVKNPTGASPGTYTNLDQNINSGAVRTDGAGKRYLDRNYSFSNPTAGPYDLQLFFLTSERDALAFVDPSAATLTNLNVTRDPGVGCKTFPTGVDNTLLTQQSSGSVNGVDWVQVSTPGFSGFFINTGLTPLPVNILSFDAKSLNNKTVQLTWNVAAEVDVKEYIVERSNDNRNWSAIGSVKASQKSTYGFNDNSPVSGVNYYRLAVKDVNASVAYSDIRTVNFSGKGNMALYPNPANNTLYVSGTDDKNVVVSIYNEVGQIVNTLSSNGETIRTGGIDVSQLLPGAYSIQVKGESGLTTMRFVKQ
ncbi:MAG: T9SS type A sorting domain-containing protein [Saprospiraceae bacterium]|nr:T9SS type A sorting domain-containing protein [Candidatus Brachybacter algidus]